MRPAPIPFDPDAIRQPPDARGFTGDVSFDEVGTEPMMLSDLLSSMEPSADEKVKLWEAAQPTMDAGPGTSTPLDNRRKWQLSDLAEAVYLVAKQAGTITPGEKLDDYRGRISMRACGRRIRHATVGDFKLIQAAFLKERGAIKAAAHALNKAATTALDIAKHCLQKALRKHRFNWAYAEGISSRIYKRPIASLETAKEVWNIIYTVNNNGNAAAGKGSPANRFKSLKAKRKQKGVKP